MEAKIVAQQEQVSVEDVQISMETPSQQADNIDLEELD